MFSSHYVGVELEGKKKIHIFLNVHYMYGLRLTTFTFIISFICTAHQGVGIGPILTEKDKEVQRDNRTNKGQSRYSN